MAVQRAIALRTVYREFSCPKGSSLRSACHSARSIAKAKRRSQSKAKEISRSVVCTTFGFSISNDRIILDRFFLFLSSSFISQTSHTTTSTTIIIIQTFISQSSSFPSPSPSLHSHSHFPFFWLASTSLLN